MICHLMMYHRVESSAAVGWPERVEEILCGDQVVAFAHVTPLKGVVITPLTNTGLCDRETGTLAPVSSSVGMWKKLQRIVEEPRVSVAYHTREHGFAGRIRVRARPRPRLAHAGRGP